jgi:hypothetical protein
MGLLWRDESTKHQKILAIVFSVIMVGPLFLMFTHNFVVEPKVSEFSSYISIFFTVFLMLMVAYWYVKKLWKPAPSWHKYSRIKKVLVVPFGPLFIFVLLWINLAISIPQLFTLLFGTDTVKRDLVVKNRRYSSRSCNYRLEPQSIDTIGFYYCISEDTYSQLPDMKIKSELFIRRSIFGYAVQDIKLLQKKR